MAPNKNAASAMEIDRLATQLAKDPHSKVFMPLSEEYGKAGMWQEAAAVLEDGLKYYPGFITAMVALGRAYDQMGQTTKAKAILEEAVKLSPENLRAHRTLVKIYSSQGLKDEALGSCAVILDINPFDEEAQSARAALGAPAKPEPTAIQKPAPLHAKPSTPSAISATVDVSNTPELPEPVRTSTVSVHPLDLAAMVEPEQALAVPAQDHVEEPIAEANPLTLAADLIESALHEHDKTGEHPAIQKSPSAKDSPPASPSPQAGVVARLETWLRTIQSRRRDQDHTKAA